MKRSFPLLLCALFAVTAAEARYIDYPGSKTVMTMNDGDMNSAHFHYTVRPYYSVGYDLDWWRDDEFTMHTGQLTWLLKRWNMPDAQANLFARGGAGIAHGDKDEFDGAIEPAASTSLEFDIEDRRLYFAYEAHYVEAGDYYDGFHQSWKTGFAPYVAEYGALHTWLMVKIEHKPEFDDPFSVTPLVRFFQGDVLTEIGVSDTGKVMFNLMVRF